MPVHVSLVTYQYTTTVTQPCASTLAEGRLRQAVLMIYCPKQLLPWHSVSPPLRFYGES